MPGANVIFHILAAVLLGIGIWYLAELRSQRDYLRRLVALASLRDVSQSSGKIAADQLFDWPEHFFRKFCKAFGIIYEVEAIDGKARTNESWAKPAKISPTQLIKLHAEYQFQSLKLKQAAKDNSSITVSFKNKSIHAHSSLPSKVDLGYRSLAINFEN